MYNMFNGAVQFAKNKSQPIIIIISIISIIVIIFYLKIDNLNMEKIVNIETTDNSKEITEEIETDVLIEKMDNPEEYINNLKSSDYKFQKLVINNSKDSLEPNVAGVEFMYYFQNYVWKLGDEWYIKDIKNKKYFVPGGLIKIKKGTEFEWLSYKGDEDIEVVMIYLYP